MSDNLNNIEKLKAYKETLEELGYNKDHPTVYALICESIETIEAKDRTIAEQAKEIERLKRELEVVTDAMNKYADEADDLWREQYD